MELRHLRYFITVAEELHFSRAAQRLGISQPPLSQQIHALEAELGTQLFKRTNRRVELTAAGTLFLSEAREALARVDRAVQVATRAGRGELGQLRIGVTSSVPLSETIPKAILAFRRAYPEVELIMREMTSREQFAPLEAGDLDVGVIRPAMLPATLKAFSILREPLVAVVHEDSPYAHQAGPLHIADIAHEPFIFFATSVGTGLFDQFLELFQRRGLSAQIVQEAGGAMTIIGLVASGLGVSILPASFKRISIEHVRYIELADRDATSEVWLTHARNRLSPQAEAFIALLKARRVTPMTGVQP